MKQLNRLLLLGASLCIVFSCQDDDTFQEPKETILVNQQDKQQRFIHHLQNTHGIDGEIQLTTFFDTGYDSQLASYSSSQEPITVNLDYSQISMIEYSATKNHFGLKGTSNTNSADRFYSYVSRENEGVYNDFILEFIVDLHHYQQTGESIDWSSFYGKINYYSSSGEYVGGSQLGLQTGSILIQSSFDPCNDSEGGDSQPGGNNNSPDNDPPQGGPGGPGGDYDYGDDNNTGGDDYGDDDYGGNTNDDNTSGGGNDDTGSDSDNGDTSPGGGGDCIEIVIIYDEEDCEEGEDCEATVVIVPCDTSNFQSDCPVFPVDCIDSTTGEVCSDPVILPTTDLNEYLACTAQGNPNCVCCDLIENCSDEDLAKQQLVQELGLSDEEAFWLFDDENSDVYDTVVELRNEFGDDELTNSVLNLIVQTHVYEGDLAFINFQDLIQKIKDAIFDGIKSAAVLMRKIYKILDKWAQNHPGVIDWINNDIDFIADGLIDDPLIHIDLDEENISWKDLLVIWFFELKDLPEQDFPEQTDWLDGPYPTISFTNGDLIIEGNADIQSVANLEGVNEARQDAINNILSGTFDDVDNSWDFEVEEYYDGITEGNAATFFLGSYDTLVTIVDVGNGEYVLNFTIENKTGWESGTRLISDEDGDGVNESIIPDKPRGEDIHLGGTIVDVFEWSEVYVP